MPQAQRWVKQHFCSQRCLRKKKKKKGGARKRTLIIRFVLCLTRVYCYARYAQPLRVCLPTVMTQFVTRSLCPNKSLSVVRLRQRPWMDKQPGERERDREREPDELQEAKPLADLSQDLFPSPSSHCWRQLKTTPRVPGPACRIVI